MHSQNIQPYASDIFNSIVFFCYFTSEWYMYVFLTHCILVILIMFNQLYAGDIFQLKACSHYTKIKLDSSRFKTANAHWIRIDRLHIANYKQTL